MRKRNVRTAAPAVIIKQVAPTVKLVEQPQIDQQSVMMQLAQLVAQQQAKLANPEPQTMDVKEAAEFLRMSPWTVRDLVRLKQIPFFRIRSRIWFRRSDLEAWIADRVNDCVGE